MPTIPTFDRSNTDPRTGLPKGKRKSKRVSFKEIKAAQRKVPASRRPTKPSKSTTTTRAKMVKNFLKTGKKFSQQ